MFDFIHKIQNSDERSKGRWMFIFTAIAMAAVIYVWLAYFNNLVSGAANSASEPAEAEEGFTFWQTMENGVSLIYGGIVDKIGLLGDILETPREYIIQPPK